MSAPLAIDSRRAAYVALVALTLIWGSNWAVMKFALSRADPVVFNVQRTWLRLPVPCTSCHWVPAYVTDAGHIDSALPAEVTGAYSALTNSNGAVLQYNAGTATCTNLYCPDGAYFRNGGVWSNGPDTSPTWNNTAYLSSTPTTTADCNKCHGYPPAGSHAADSNCRPSHGSVTTATSVSWPSVRARASSCM